MENKKIIVLGMVFILLLGIIPFVNNKTMGARYYDKTIDVSKDCDKVIKVKGITKHIGSEELICIVEYKYEKRNCTLFIYSGYSIGGVGVDCY